MVTTVLAILLVSAAPLVDAVKSGNKAAAIALIDERADVNAPEADGTTRCTGRRIRTISSSRPG
jgi:hypothetical protein